MLEKKEKAQITIEYLIILSVMILLFSAVSMDLISSSLTNTMQIQTSELIRQANSSFQHAITELSTQASGSSETIKLRSSADCDFIVMPSYLLVNCSPSSASFNEFNNTKIAEAPSGISYNCLTCTGGVVTNEERQIIQISKQ